MARQLEGIKFALGSTMAFRRRDLAAIGGFEALADYLADDYHLGQRIAALGLKVELSDVVVETFLPRYTVARISRSPTALGACRARFAVLGIRWPGNQLRPGLGATDADFR